MIALNYIGLALVASVAHALPNAVKRFSGKAGVSWPVQAPDASPLVSLFGAGSALTWWYDWNKNAGTFLTGTAALSAEFVSMCFDATCATNGVAYDPTTNILLGFNEPDNDKCANLSPAAAAAAWPGVVANARAARPGIKLAAPSVMMFADKWWIDQFFAAICPSGLAGCDVAPDYLAVHAYSLAVADLQTELNSWHGAYPTLDVIVTEFACTTFGGAVPTLQQVKQYMNDAVTFLDATPWVVKYAWFGATNVASTLVGVAPVNRLNDDTGAITDLGTQYRNGGLL